MKKRFWVLLLGVLIILGGGDIALSEGIQIHEFKDGTKIEAPELAPVALFTLKKEMVFSHERFNNGKGIIFSLNKTEDFEVSCNLLWVVMVWPPDGDIEGKDIHLVSVGVKYGEKDWEYLVDPDFLKTGKPSDKLEWWFPEGKPSVEIFRTLLKREAI